MDRHLRCEGGPSAVKRLYCKSPDPPRSAGVVTDASRHIAQLSGVPETIQYIDSGAVYQIVKVPSYDVDSHLKLVNGIIWAAIPPFSSSR